jgi:hypothetical protein
MFGRLTVRISSSVGTGAFWDADVMYDGKYFTCTNIISEFSGGISIGDNPFVKHGAIVAITIASPQLPVKISTRVAFRGTYYA